MSYIYDAAGNPVEHIDASGTVTYYQHDQYGSTRLLTDSAGISTATFTFDAFGNLTSKTGTADTVLRWNDQCQDSDTGLYYLRNRYFDPTTAQFISVDPLRATTLNAYGYGGANPMANSDPLGLDWQNDTASVLDAVAFGSSLVGAAASFVGFGCLLAGSGHCAGTAAFIAEASTVVALGADAGRMVLRNRYELDIIALDTFSVATMGAGQGVNAAYRLAKMDRHSRKMLIAGINFAGGAAGLGGVTKDFTEWLSGEGTGFPYCPGPVGSPQNEWELG